MLADAFVYLIAAVVMVPLASRFGLGSVLGYLVAGVLIGPVLGLVGTETQDIQHFAEFGVVMMLFLVGLELQPKMLWQMRHRLLGLGGLQVTVTAAAFFAIGALGFDLAWQSALAIGLMLALSSTAIVLQSLNEKGQMKSAAGESSFSVLLFQDIAVIPILALIPLLALPELSNLHGATDDGHGGGSFVDHLSPILRTLVTLGAVAAVVVAGRFGVNPLLHYIAKSKLREMFTATALMLVIGIALLMTMVGLSPALGTFVAGVVLADSEFRHELESDIDPFKGLLLGLFFITVGCGIDFAVLGENVSLVLAITVGLIAVKAAVIYGLGTLFKVNLPDRWLFALGLAQAGEFAFVLLGFTVQNAVITAEMSKILNLVVALSMFLTPALFIFYDRVIVARAVQAEAREQDTIDETGSVIIAGQGRFGQIINRLMMGNGFSTVVIDHRSEQVEMLKKFGVKTFFGDASRPDLLHAAGLHSAKMLIVAIDDMHAAIEMIKHARRERPDIHIVARASDRSDVYRMYYAGANDIIRETFDASVRAGRSALEALGVHPHAAERRINAFREIDRDMMLLMAQHWNDDIPPYENEAYVAEGRRQLKIMEDALAGKRTIFQEKAERGWSAR
ncbi:MAG: cation:proton antiporter [Gammaproteobacteria bacterium]|nr:cation:proton antiporter [Gammaproteobacteria bacterium]